MPLIQTLIFGLALSNEVRNVRLKVIYEPKDVFARRIEERALASGWFIHTNTDDTDPIRLVQKGLADVVIVMPEGGLTKSVERKEGRLQLIIDASNAIRARSIENYLRMITLQVTHDMAPQMPTTLPVTFDTRMLFNPSMRTPVFLVPAVMCMILCLLAVILTSMAISREKELGTFETLIAAPVQTWEVLVGKTLPYALLAMADVPVILAVAVFGFQVPMVGALWKIGLAAVVFVCTAVSVGTLISTFAKNQQQAMMGGFIFIFPAIQLSGIMAPLDNIPLFFKFVAFLNPLKYFVALLRNIMLKGGDPVFFWPNVGMMAALCTVAMAVSFRRFHKKLN
jgi:ABC-2 type transport system permease protein